MQSKNKAFHRLTRILAALCIAFICFCVSWFKLSERAVEASDFSFPLRAAARLRMGLNPYQDSSVSLHRPYPFQTPFPYPLPAALLAWPFSYLGGDEARLVVGPPAFSESARRELIAINKANSAQRLALKQQWLAKYSLTERDKSDWRTPELAAALFMGVSSFILALSILLSPDFKIWKLLIFASPSFYVALGVGQWSPLLVAGAFFFPLLGLCVAKPNVALPLLLHSLQKKHSKQEWQILIGVASALVICAFIVMPTWPLEWFNSVRGQTEKPYFSPFLYGIGPVLALLTLLRIRTSGATLVLALGLLPQHSFFYDTFALGLVPRSAKQYIALFTTQWLGFLTLFWLHGFNGFALSPNLPGALNRDIPVCIVCFFYAPAVVLLWWQEKHQVKLG